MATLFRERDMGALNCTREETRGQWGDGGVYRAKEGGHKKDEKIRDEAATSIKKKVDTLQGTGLLMASSVFTLPSRS